MKKQYNSLDLFKFIFAIIVIAIHTTPLKDFGDTINWFFSNTICNTAVPFFFVASGFLLFDKLQNLSDVEMGTAVKKYSIHILKMYLIWCIIWLPFKVLNAFTSGQNDVQYYLNHIKNVLISSGGDALWYLLALFYSVIIIYSLKKKLCSKLILIISAVFYVVGYIISSWYGVFKGMVFVKLYYSVFDSTFNALFYGLLYISIGMCIAEKRGKLQGGTYAIGFIICFALNVIEAIIINHFALNKDGDCRLVSMPFAIWMLFEWILSLDVRDNALLIKIRDYSTLMYLSHCVIIRIYRIALSIIGVDIPYTMFFIVVLASSLIFAMAIRYLAKEKSVRLFRLLY